MERQAFLSGLASTFAATLGPARTALADLEKRYGGRLGVCAANSATGERLEHRADERFPMCSTFKVLLVAAVLARVDAGEERPDRHIAYGRMDLLDYAPATRANVRFGSMPVRDLCAAAIEVSDNTAANLLIHAIGGPAAVTAYARSLGDSQTRLDRVEPRLNTALPGDVRDTTTPAEMAANLQRLLTARALSGSSRSELRRWLLACRTGSTSIRAGVPATWLVGDKTGSCDHATVNDIAVLERPLRAPIFVAAYYTGSTASEDERYGVLAEIGGIVASTFA